MSHHQDEILLVGAGIAGAAIAQAFLQQGQTVRVLDAGPKPASGTSAHAFALAHPGLIRARPLLQRLTYIAFALAQQTWQPFWREEGIFQALKSGTDFAEDLLNAQLLTAGFDQASAQPLRASEARRLTGVARDGIWFPKGATINLEKTCATIFSEQEKLTYAPNTLVASLSYDGLHWHALDKDGSSLAKAKSIVLACAHGAKALVADLQIALPLKPVRGQLNQFHISATSAWLQYLPTAAISGEGYCLPARHDVATNTYTLVVGSSYDENETSLASWPSSDMHNKQQAAALLHYAEGDLSELNLAGTYVGVRCAANDRLPIIGEAPTLPGLYIATALGSRGVLWSALAAAIITAQVQARLEQQALAGESTQAPSAALARLARLGLSADLLAAVSPARFLAGALPAALASNSNPIFPLGSSAK